jgi:GT2 family glycosyltransferase
VSLEKLSLPDVCIIVLNWRSPKDTCECIASIKNVFGERCGLVVVDNNSGDTSVEDIKACMDKEYGGYLLVRKEDVRKEMAAQAPFCESMFPVLLSNDVNAGYAGGNNLGIMAAYHRGHRYFWIVNNDGTIGTDALDAMTNAFFDERMAFVGSVVIKPDQTVECYGGGVYFPFLGRVKRLITREGFADAGINRFLMGSSLMTSRRLLEDVGLMNEGYFMYWEEVDWQVRALRKGYQLRVEDSSLFVHKSADRARGYPFYFYRTRASILFVRRFYGISAAAIAFLFVLVSESAQNVNRLDAIKWIFSGAFRGLVDSLPADRQIKGDVS